MHRHRRQATYKPQGGRPTAGSLGSRTSGVLSDLSESVPLNSRREQLVRQHRHRDFPSSY